MAGSQSEKNFFRQYQEHVLGKPNTEVLSAEQYFNKLNSNVLLVSAFAYCMLCLVRLITFWTNSALQSTPHRTLSAISLGVLIVASVLIVLYGKLICRERARVGARVIFLLYYTVLIATVTFQSILRNIALTQSGVAVFYTGVPIIVCMLFLLTAAPLPHRTDSVILGVELLIATVLPVFFPGAESYSLPRYLLLFAAMVASYVFFWHLFRRHIENYNVSVTLSEKMIRASYLDGLTHILNRRALDKYLRSLCAACAIW